MDIIIDGYNLIRQSERWRRAERTGLEAARNALLSSLRQYSRDRSHSITVVFDGWMEGSSREEHRNEGGIGVVYSRRGERADDVIKRLSRNRGEGLLVVTSDRDIARFVTKAGAAALSSPEFERRMYVAAAGEATREADPSPEEDDHRDGTKKIMTTKKKGPSRKPSKRERKTAQAVKRL